MGIDIRPVAGAAGGSLTVLDEGGIVLGGVSTLNIVGVDHNAVATGPSEVTIYAPESAFSPYYNTGSATVASITTSNRNISSPLPENNFKIGGWAAGTLHPCIRTGTAIYDTGGDFSIENIATTFTVQVIDSDGLTTIFQHQITLTNNYDAWVNNIRIEITNWGAEALLFKARAKVTLNLAAMFLSGGRFQVLISHVNGGAGTFTKTQGPMFYDTEPNAQTISGVTIVENTINSSKYLSGIRYYDETDTFDIGIADMDYLPSDSYPGNLVTFNSNTFYGISNFNLTSASLTGWSNLHGSVNASYAGTKAIDRDDFRYIGIAGTVTGQVLDWTPGATASSANSSILIDTWDQESNELAEYFTDETFRRTSAGLVWDSTQSLIAYDGGTAAQVIGGILKVPDTNFSTYLPGGNPNYTTLAAGPGQYYRRYIDITNNVRNSGRFTISGFTLQNLKNEDIRIWIDIPGRFISPCYLHSNSVFNFGTFTGNNDPIRKPDPPSTASIIEFSMGNLGLTPAQNYMIFHLEIVNTVIEPDSIILSW